MGSAVNGGESYDVTFATCSSEQLWEPNADDVSGACAATHHLEQTKERERVSRVNRHY